MLSKEQRRRKNSTPRLVELTDEQATKYKSGAANDAVKKKPTGPNPRDVKRESCGILSKKIHADDVQARRMSRRREGRGKAVLRSSRRDGHKY